MSVFARVSTAVISILLFVFAVLYGAGVQLPSLLKVIDPSAAALAGLLLANIHLFLRPGYRRPVFYLILAAADALMLLPLPGFLHDGAVTAASAFLLLTARWVSSRPVNPFRRVLPAVGVLTVMVLAFSQLLFSSLAPGEGMFEPAGRMERVMASLSPAAARYREEIEHYLISRSESDEGEQEVIEELNSRILELEAERRRFEELQRESLLYREEIALLEKRLKELPVPVLDEDDLRQVSTYAEAVRPRVPLVRDFAVRLASSVPGSYYAAPGSLLPGETGIRQVLVIHRYLAGSWKYVNDPIAGRTDFISPADRTIALGLAGDCDDFAVLMASCVESIGGRARILHGTCAEGAHAWCEVELGSRSTHPNGNWLSLDWEAGAYSCGNNPVIFYQSGGGI